MELKKVEVDMGSQEIEQFDVNPYEVVIALSKKAREYNSKAMKYLGPETEIKPLSAVLHKLYTDDKVVFTYDKEDNNKAGHAPAPLEEPTAPVKARDKKDEQE